MIMKKPHLSTSKQQGFTLIELMIVVAIIGILIIIAFPVYQQFSVRAKVSELILATADAKISITEFAQIEDNLTGSGIGLSIPIDSDFITGSTISDDGVIEVTGDAAALGAETDVTITMTPTLETSGKVTWDCTSGADARYVPSTCRN